MKIILEDGSVYHGSGFGSSGKRKLELVFNTSMVGYQEIISDPSYTDQAIVMTYPVIGNYGINTDDFESGIPGSAGVGGIAGPGALIVRDYTEVPSNFRCGMTLSEHMELRGITGVNGVDTREITRRIRDHGSCKVMITGESDDDEKCLDELREWTYATDQVSRVSTPEIREYAAGSDERYHVVAIDCGIKTNIIRCLNKLGCRVTLVPFDTGADRIQELKPDGVFISNGPGDPDAVSGTYEQVQMLLGEVPVFGICMGHQMICKAAGARMEKLKFGHHGGNHPVVNLLTGRVEITAQNHGFNVDFPSLGPLDPACSGGRSEHVQDLRSWHDSDIVPVVSNDRYGKVRLTHVNLNDGTAEGIAFTDIPAFSVQYHPEACPGPADSHYLFTAFARLMDGKDNYLDIDIAQDRLEGWRF